MATIELRPDGPIAISGPFELKDAAGKDIVHAEVTVKLCRCGGSQNKPFCDGTHRRNGFSGARIADGSADRVEQYAGTAITIHDNRSVCAHAGYCTDGLPGVFRYGSEPWIDPAGGLPQQVLELVRRCPSGALSYGIDGAAPKAEEWKPSVTVTKDGPYAVLGIELADVPFAQGVPRNRYTLCRCGASKNKPFCDGSHWDAAFKG
jgi:CDGSH-type Zn-finger protein